PAWLDTDPTLGAKWSVVSDPSGSKVLAQTGSPSDWAIFITGNLRWTDEIVEAKVRFTGAPSMAGVFGRFRDGRDYYWLYLDSSNVILKKRVDGSSATIAKTKLMSQPVTGTWYSLRLALVGSSLTGFVDGTKLVDATDSSLAAGSIGLGTS